MTRNKILPGPGNTPTNEMTCTWIDRTLNKLMKRLVEHGRPQATKGGKCVGARSWGLEANVLIWKHG